MDFLVLGGFVFGEDYPMNYNFTFAHLVILIFKQFVIFEMKFDYMRMNYLKLLIMIEKVWDTIVLKILTP